MGEATGTGDGGTKSEGSMKTTAQTTAPKETKAAKSPDLEIWEKAMEEHRAVGVILEALKPLSQKERRRVMGYFWDRYVANPDMEGE